MTNNLKRKSIVFFLNWVQGQEEGLTGGDRIWIELAKKWSPKTKLSILGSEEAVRIGRKNISQKIEMLICSKEIRSKNLLSVNSLFKNSISRTIKGFIFLRTFLKNNKVDYLYSSSDFPADSIPCFLTKLLHPKLIWIAGFYLFAPPFWDKNSPYKKIAFFRGFAYWFSQIPTYLLINLFADLVFVTSEPDKRKFINSKREEEKVIVVRGGVDVTGSKNYKQTGKNKKYLACFIGRLHYQKGVLELVDIWKRVVGKNSKAKLAIIGNGELKSALCAKIKDQKMKKNIDLFGFMDGEAKFEIFKNSKIIVHPAIFDSGGMAAAEGMAWGLPGVSFDLESLKTYYPKGMLKTPCFNLDQFADNILKLNEDSEKYKNYSKEAQDLINQEWDWDKRAERIFDKVFRR
ncbi:hypothetical protein COS93_02105 [bacterium (Candidatus Gribaldobacteria) CG07_land_8_20_14_0_80_33_18]|uniref:Glycosyl transferase family 1 domain-containing protein n=1 Tax=bacterium (Candidatus Gribaldobacteria) CG07_land_8_20_14_0_80_33_18 TaxID=2014272 RepID=A0A2M6Z2H4_9BACT|nr:MAG: hypothetical protein COS93_02105 [bacterium (Candidatus Gribaldobacteria) CG07_land_8_20_14_0_80_33_18]PJB09021.1 MAG: hypothetical protein CO122_00325 [bacterium (Candidatus Gribaldobacteria) CG_4_9_14_3_um_filter_33_9]